MNGKKRSISSVNFSDLRVSSSARLINGLSIFSFLVVRPYLVEANRFFTPAIATIGFEAFGCSTLYRDVITYEYVIVGDVV